MTVGIRRGESRDIDWLLEQLKAFSRTFGTSRDLYGTDASAREGITNLVVNHLVLLACRGEQRLGFVAGLIAPHMFNKEILVLTELFWWVSEEHRGSRAGLMLLDSFLDYGRGNCHWVTFSLQDQSPVNDRILLKRGFKMRECAYLQEVN
jgi:hypothetical protein